MIFSIFLVFLAVLLSGISQVLMKIGSSHKTDRKDTVLVTYLNLPTGFAYGLLVIVTMICVIALQEIPSKQFYAISSLGFIVVLFLSFVFLKERVTVLKMAATMLIITGVIIFNI